MTVPEIAVNFEVTHPEAEKVLENMRMDGVFNLEIVQDTGAIVYNLSNYADNTDKENTNSVI